MSFYDWKAQVKRLLNCETLPDASWWYWFTDFAYTPEKAVETYFKQNN